MKSLDGRSVLVSSDYRPARSNLPHHLRRHVHDRDPKGRERGARERSTRSARPSWSTRRRSTFMKATPTSSASSTSSRRSRTWSARRSTTIPSPCSTRGSGSSTRARPRRRGRRRSGSAGRTCPWATVAFKKIRFRSLDAIGYHPLDLPRLNLETVAFWIRPGRVGPTPWMRIAGQNPSRGSVRPPEPAHHAPPASRDVRPARPGRHPRQLQSRRAGDLLYDRYPGGLGYAERGYAIVEELIAHARLLGGLSLRGRGCPSCVGLPVLRPAQQQDYDLHGGWPIPNKAATTLLLRRLLGR